ncbi:8-oxo-dGTP pyrophosphatase MutT (NUDIX family) [Aquamicrobium terrae]
MLSGPLTDNADLTERMRKLFGTVPRRLQVAALPWRRHAGAVEVMLITSRDTGRWVVPKGWPEAREPLCEAAAREAREEAGLTGAISPFEAGRYFYAKALSSGQEVPCEVLVFPLRVDSVADRWKEQNQRERRWVFPADAACMVKEPDLGRIITGFGADPEKFAA